jgi:integrase
MRLRELQHRRNVDVDAKRHWLHTSAADNLGIRRFVPLDPDTLAANERCRLSLSSQFVLGDTRKIFLRLGVRELRKICSKIGLIRGSVHMLRNSFALRLSNEGGNHNRLRYIMDYRDVRVVALVLALPTEPAR